MYNFVNWNFPALLLDMFEYQADDYSYNTRHIKDPQNPKFQTDVVRKSLLYNGMHDWFNLEADVKAATSKKHSGIHFSDLNWYPIKFMQARVRVSL